MAIGASMTLRPAPERPWPWNRAWPRRGRSSGSWGAKSSPGSRSPLDRSRWMPWLTRSSATAWGLVSSYSLGCSPFARRLASAKEVGED